MPADFAPPPHPRLSVVMTTYNRRDRLAEVLEPLLADPGADEVVVVVDGCHDGSLELLESIAAGQPKLRPVMADPNRGQPRARLLGVEQARGESILCLDDDVLADPGLATKHREAQAGEKGLIVLGYMPTRLSDKRRRGDFATREYEQVYEDHCREYERNPDEIMTHLWAGNFSMRRDDFLAGTEGYDFPLTYHEDRDLGLRFRRLGLRGTFDRDLSATHHHSRDYRSYLREARSAGRGAAILHAMHTDVIGDFSPDDPLPTYPRSVRVLARASDVAAMHRLIVAVLSAAVALAGRTSRFELEFRLARVAKVIEIRQGARGARPEAENLARREPSGARAMVGGHRAV